MTIRVLHLVGSPTSDFHRELSELYARACIAALDDPTRYAFIIALITPDGFWRFPRSLDRAAVAAAAPMPLEQAMAVLAAANIDIALPQMFCRAGMTEYRALLELLKIPYLGNPPLQMAIAADKAKARAIVAAGGVGVPDGELLRRGELPTLTAPAVVKPNDADNSDGVSLVRSVEGYPAALAAAFAYSETVLVERYIELGREVRCGIVVEDGDLRCLPLEEYFVDAVQRPVRTRTDKLQRDAANDLTLAAKTALQSWIVAADDPIVEAVWAAARSCHAALGCEQYSLFDFRIDPAGQPWFLEASLYCSFAPQSVIVTMMAAAGTPLDRFFAGAIEQALGSTKPKTS